jgi:hypothetical protein
MNNKEAPESRTVLWGRHIQDWQKTEQSQSAYCRDLDLNYHRFTYWRRKFANQSSPAQHSVQRSGFIPVKPCSSVDAQGLTATLPNGVLLQGITISNLQVVKQLLGLLP